MIFDALPTNERNVLLGVKAPSKPQPCPSSNETLSVVAAASRDNPSEGARSAGNDENQMMVREAGRSKGAANPERATERAAKVGLFSSANMMVDCVAYLLKEKERLEKKAVKAEKEKKNKESQEKARSMMASFFGKPKTPSTTTSPSKGPTPSSSKTLSDFDRVFRPFVLKRDAELAPVNWFRDARRKQRADADVIVIDEDDAEVHDIEISEPEPSPSASPRSLSFLRYGGCHSLNE
jgi:chromatin assembly factor 1 subunit A